MAMAPISFTVLEHRNGEHAIARQPTGQPCRVLGKLDLSKHRRYGPASLFERPARCHRIWAASNWILRQQLGRGHGGGLCRAAAECISFITEQHAELGVADARRVLQHGWNTGSRSPGELDDDAQHLGGRGLLLQRLSEIVRALAQFVEQPRVLDGDDGLGGEVLHQLDLLVGEGADLLAVDDR